MVLEKKVVMSRFTTARAQKPLNPYDVMTIKDNYIPLVLTMPMEHSFIATYRAAKHMVNIFFP